MKKKWNQCRTSLLIPSFLGVSICNLPNSLPIYGKLDSLNYLDSLNCNGLLNNQSKRGAKIKCDSLNNYIVYQWKFWYQLSSYIKDYL